MDTPPFTLHKYFETYRETSYREHVVGSVPSGLDKEIHEIQHLEAITVINESDTPVRWRSDGQDPTLGHGALLKEETFSRREVLQLRLVSEGSPVTLRLLIHEYRK